MFWVIFIGFAVLSWLISASLENKFKKFSEVALPMTGKEIAEKMLRENGITDVTVTCTRGHLTDHYNPSDKTVNLSESVYHSASVAAAAVAAHECGHALQHATAYAPLRMRSALVPVVSFANKWVMWVILAGMIVIESFPQLLWFGIGLYALTTLFAFNNGNGFLGPPHRSLHLCRSRLVQFGIPDIPHRGRTQINTQDIPAP